MKASRAGLNPFIVLSDVTITTLVVMCSLLMLFSASLLSTARIERRKEEIAQRIENQHLKLLEVLKEDKKENKAVWDKGVSVLMGKGLQSCVFRILGAQLFDPKHPEELTPMGHQVVKRWAEVFGPEFAKQQVCSADAESGCLNEVQLRGHCSPESERIHQANRDPLSAVDPASALPSEPIRAQHHGLTLTLARALNASVDILATPGFPTHLLTVAGLSTNRPVYRNTTQMAIDKLQEEGRVNNTEDLEKEKAGYLEEKKAELVRNRAPKPPPYLDRIDILLVYSGDSRDNSFVAPSDGTTVFGNLNDSSSDRARL